MEDAKAASNLIDHGVSFEEASFAHADPRSDDYDDRVDPGAQSASPSTQLLAQ